MQIAVIEGDDAAPEAMKPSVELLDTLNLYLDLGLDWAYPVVGEQAKLDHGTTFPEEAKKIIDASDTTYFGSTSGSASKALFYLRSGRQTFANVRPCRYLEGARSPLVDPITQPRNFDVVVMPNLYGDIMSDAAAGLMGGLGLAASGGYGKSYAYFEPAHGTAPDIRGKTLSPPPLRC